MSQETEVLPEIKVKELIDNEHSLILYNDDVNTFDFVIDSLIEVCEHEVEQAVQCTFLVHYKGKCAVKNGAYNPLKTMKNKLQSKGLTAEVN